MAYKDVAAAWLNTDEKTGEKYLSVVLKQDMKEGERLFLRKNTFKKEGEKSPDYRYSVKVEENEADQVANDIDF